MENPQLDDLLNRFVRDRAGLSAAELETITDQANVQYGINHLIGVKRDVESQFIAYKTRIKDFYAICEEAIRNNKLVEVEVETMDGGYRRRAMQKLPPGEAYAKFAAREGRWKVKNVRFLSLIEGAIADLKNPMSTPEPKEVARGPAKEIPQHYLDMAERARSHAEAKSVDQAM
jgi:hypothetical protein